MAMLRVPAMNTKHRLTRDNAIAGYFVTAQIASPFAACSAISLPGKQRIYAWLITRDSVTQNYTAWFEALRRTAMGA